MTLRTDQVRPHIDIQTLEDQINTAERNARSLVAGLTEEEGVWRMTPGTWSIAECLDHLAITNRLYLAAMEEAAEQARQRGRMRRGPAMPGWFGRWFVNLLEPPVNPRFKLKAPRMIQPRKGPALADAFARHEASQHAVRSFLRTNADLDLAGILFPNPFIRGIRFSLATGLHNIVAHERRHLWQAWSVRRAAETAVELDGSRVWGLLMEIAHFRSESAALGARSWW
jgi:hypothetical protein